jgi:hypothetical protein
VNRRRRRGFCRVTARSQAAACLSVLAGCNNVLGIHELDAAGNTGASGGGVADGTVLSTLDAADHLRLWLSAARGITCDAGRVERWADRSGNGNDATLALGQLGPRCGLHQSSTGIDLPYFSAPVDNANFIDETLDVDLSWLVGSEYTIFVVERRWADTGFFIGTTAPDQGSLACGATRDSERALQFGYVTYPGTLSLAIDHTCDGQQGPVPSTPDPPPGALSLDIARFSAAYGHQLWANGELFVPDGTPGIALRTADGGAIGRSFTTLTSTHIDARFVGDIAEVLVYDAALSNADRASVVSYLEADWHF